MRFGDDCKDSKHKSRSSIAQIFVWSYASYEWTIPRRNRPVRAKLRFIFVTEAANIQGKKGHLRVKSLANGAGECQVDVLRTGSGTCVHAQSMSREPSGAVLWQSCR